MNYRLNILFPLLCAWSVLAHSNDVVLDEIVAIVNEGVVLRSEVQAETDFLASQARASGQSLPKDSVLTTRVLERLISQEIQRQRARQLGVEVDTSSINEAIARVAAGNNMTTSQFRDTLRNEGFNYSYYRSTIEQELLLSRLIQRDVEQTINISDQEIDDFIASTTGSDEQSQAYRLRHILIAVPESAARERIDAAKAKMTTLKEKLAAGANFSEVAAAESDGRRALEGGDLGWRQLQELPGFLHVAVRQTPVGEVSDTVQSPDGFHIVKIEDKRNREERTVQQTRIRHIFLDDNNDNSAEAQTTLATLRQRIIDGASFAEMARANSNDPNSASNGGELQWLADDDMPPEMQQAAATLEPGLISSPFRTRFGWHIIEVLERRDINPETTNRRRNAELTLRQRKMEQETERWSRRLRDEAFVEIKGAEES